jgi:hypothetical protein
MSEDIFGELSYHNHNATRFDKHLPEMNTKNSACEIGSKRLPWHVEVNKEKRLPCQNE